MLQFITSVTDPLIAYIKDDPVRPEIAPEWRVGTNRFIATNIEESPLAILCVCLMDHVPDATTELGWTGECPTIAVFYTIWSYVPGAGVELLLATVQQIRKEFPDITRFVTLSPKTQMAHRFHIKNGAIVFRENEDTVNYEYLINQA